MLTRSVSGIIYVAIIVGCCAGSLYGVTILAGLMALLAIIEFAKICHDAGNANFPVVILDSIMAICLATGIYIMPLAIWLICLIGRFILELYLENPRPLRNLAHSLMGQLYIALPLFLMTLVPTVFPPGDFDVKIHPFFGTAMLDIPYQWPMLLAVFIMIWINDTGAFITGSLLGRHKLFERISPKKTWEGFFGGLAFNLGTSALFCYFGGEFFVYHGQIWFWLGLGTIITVFGTWGDLVESMIKRNLNIKDSGELIPGHGGILDRIDSLLLAAPASFIYFLCYYCFWYA